jgi:hypothetical protein
MTVLGAVGAAASIAGAVLAINGCSADSPDEDQQQSAATAPSDGTSVPISQLPLVDSATSPSIVGELLAKPTAAGETTAIHVQLPAPANQGLAKSLVRIVGPDDSPQIVFSSDALAKLGVIGKSPGPDFFTAFASLSPDQLVQLQRNAADIKAGKLGRPTNESVIFDGRSAVARTNFPAIDPSQFIQGGGFGPINRCFLQPAQSQAAWGKSLFITDPAIVQDPLRTWDPCTGAGTQGGVWTFAHFVREMASGSMQTPEQFALDWLSSWLNNYAVNGDVVAARQTMFAQVIQPWATASGVTATLVTDASGHRSVAMTGPLDLDIAPFRLLAIVNRIDLGDSTTGPSGYSGTLTSQPTTAGELRFIFDVVQPNPWGAGSEASCGRKRFTTIFEYGVPRTGCGAVVAWAQAWTSLLAFPGFTDPYKAQLESMTESVVRHGSAPAKGNQNAIDQIRTNEIELGLPLGLTTWELREFTLNDEDPVAGTSTPSDGELRPHTVALTPNDGAFSATGTDPTINAFVNGPVTAGVTLPVSNPAHCDASYNVPYSISGAPFLGGNALIPPASWRANSVTAASPAANICARHQFSLNTCSGCHHDDTATNGGTSTNFTQIDVMSSPPVTLSKFLTGLSPTVLFGVNDTQLGSSLVWNFGDLNRRFGKLIHIADCTSCARIVHLDPRILQFIQQLGPVPIDPGVDVTFPFKTGPITSLDTVQKILDMRPKFTGAPVDQAVDFIHGVSRLSE